MNPQDDRLDSLASDVARNVSLAWSREFSEIVPETCTGAHRHHYQFGVSFGLAYAICSGMGLPGADFDYVHIRALANVFRLQDAKVLELWHCLKDKPDEDFIQGLVDAKGCSRAPVASPSNSSRY